MNLQQLSEGLNNAFVKENHRIVFWFDPEADFETDIESLALPDVNIVNMKSQSSLGIKLKLELEDTKGKYLLYFPIPEPAIDKDWLLDIKLYSRRFYADRFSIIFNELGLQQQSLREHLAKRDKFLASKARLNVLKKWVQPDFDEQELELAMIASVVKAENCDLPHVLFSMADQMVAVNLGLEDVPAAISEMEKFGLLPSFVLALQKEVGYPAEAGELSGEIPLNFGRFLIRLLTTGFCESIGDVPDWAQGLAIASGGAKATSRALLSRWRDSSRYYKAFDGVSQWVADAIRIKEKLGDVHVSALAEVATFEVVEQRIIIDIARDIEHADMRALAEWTSIISNRLDNYWATRLKDDDTRKKYRTLYTALSAAIKLFTLRLDHKDGFHYKNTHDLFKAYESDLYQFDMAYRHYCEASYGAHSDVLKVLDKAVEQCYSNWYIDNLAKNWGDNVNTESRLEDWKVKGINNQQTFYANNIQNSKAKRTVVIISDAFRYEAAVELTNRINEKREHEAKITSQLGVVPSYTALGMASLLPHNTLEYRENAGDDVFVDGKSSQGTVARNKILSEHGGMAVTAEEVIKWSKAEGNEAIKDHTLVYVYQNIVDTIGDTATSESMTFSAVEDAITELTKLTNKVLTQFKTSTVIVTADHGFLFQQSKLDISDRTSLTEKPTNTLKSKKRYVIGFDLPEPKDALYGSTTNTAGTISDTRFWVPKGANRFHFVGGARFVHGGIMPQEIVVPVITVNKLSGEKAAKRTKRKVGVICPKSGLRMMNSIQIIDLMQTEAVSEHVQQVTVSAAIYDVDKIVSSEEVITFNSDTDSADDRVKKVKISLSGSNFDRNKDYFLILKDKDLNTVIERYRVTIDLAFTDDFF